jgi:hypothetical protein
VPVVERSKIDLLCSRYGVSPMGSRSPEI